MSQGQGAVIKWRVSRREFEMTVTPDDKTRALTQEDVLQGVGRAVRSMIDENKVDVSWAVRQVLMELSPELQILSIPHARKRVANGSTN